MKLIIINLLTGIKNSAIKRGFLIIVIYFFLFSCKSDLEKGLEMKFENSKVNKSLEVFDLKDYTNFEWTDVYIIDMEPLEEEVSKLLNSNLEHAGYFNDTNFRFIFVNKKNIVKEIWYYHGKRASFMTCNYDITDISEHFTRSEAVFVVSYIYDGESFQYILAPLKCVVNDSLSRSFFQYDKDSVALYFKNTKFRFNIIRKFNE